jgi:hypothetical protein
MAEQKITLTNTTSISDIANFFQGLDDTQKVRARQTKEGSTELYVRGSSKWHLLTDNLKFGFFVTRDYQAAQEKITDILNQNGALKSIRNPQENLKNIFSNHKHDFHVEEIKNDFKSIHTALTQQEISKKISKILKIIHYNFTWQLNCRILFHILKMDSIQILTQHWNLQNLFNTQIKK